RNFMFITGIIIGLLIGPKAELLSFLNLPVLIIIMTSAMIQINLKDLANIKRSLKPALNGIFLNHIAAGIIIISLGYLFFQEDGLWAGIVLTAASPPGVGIMPFSVILGGNIFYSASGVFAGFISSVFIAPLLVKYLIGPGIVEPSAVFSTLVKLILIPLVISRIIRLTGTQEKIKKYTGPIVNTGFSILFVILFGVNRHMFFKNIPDLLKLVLIFSASVFGLAIIIRLFLKNSKVSDSTYTSIILLATIKNSLFGASIGLALIGTKAAMPGTVLTFVIILYLLFVEKFVSR
ncbi:MAG: hypothetical protein ACQEQC_07340, partial [Elusimicrobiota bacterium]